MPRTTCFGHVLLFCCSTLQGESRVGSHDRWFARRCCLLRSRPHTRRTGVERYSGMFGCGGTLVPGSSMSPPTAPVTYAASRRIAFPLFSTGGYLFPTLPGSSLQYIPCSCPFFVEPVCGVIVLTPQSHRFTTPRVCCDSIRCDKSCFEAPCVKRVL